MGGQETSGSGSNNAGAMGVYDPNYNYGGNNFDWTSAIGKAAGQFGQSIASGSKYTPPNLSSGGPYQTGVINQPIQTTSRVNPIPSIGGGGGLDLIALLRRLGINL
jgi:hypothetical protein